MNIGNNLLAVLDSEESEEGASRAEAEFALGLFSSVRIFFVGSGIFDISFSRRH